MGLYRVDMKGVEALLAALDLVYHPSSLVFIDEIGKIECMSQRFVRLLESLLSSGKAVVATVASRWEGLIGAVKLRPDAMVH